MTHTARATREGRLWVVDIPGVGVTQGRNLGEAHRMAVDLVEIVTGQTDPHVELVLDDPLFTDLPLLREQQAEAARAVMEASEKLREAVQRFAAAGLSGADMAKALEVSPQRVSQLLNSSASVARGATEVTVGPPRSAPKSSKGRRAKSPPSQPAKARRSASA